MASESPRRPPRSLKQLAATVRASAAQFDLCTVDAEGALEGADSGVHTLVRQVAIAALAVGPKGQHVSELQMGRCRNDGSPQVRRGSNENPGDEGGDHDGLHRMVAFTVKGTPFRKEVTPMTDRTCMPAGPNSATSRSDAPSRTRAWSAKSGVVFNDPCTSRICSTSSRLPIAAFVAASRSVHADLARR